MTSEMLLVFSQRASFSPTFTSRESVLIDAMVNNSSAVMRRLLKIIFKNLNILNFVPESVMVCGDSGTHSPRLCADSGG